MLKFAFVHTDWLFDIIVGQVAILFKTLFRKTIMVAPTWVKLYPLLNFLILLWIRIQRAMTTNLNFTVIKIKKFTVEAITRWFHLKRQDKHCNDKGPSRNYVTRKGEGGGTAGCDMMWQDWGKGITDVWHDIFVKQAISKVRSVTDHAKTIHKKITGKN